MRQDQESGIDIGVNESAAAEAGSVSSEVPDVPTYPEEKSNARLSQGIQAIISEFSAGYQGQKMKGLQLRSSILPERPPDTISKTPVMFLIM